MAELPFSNDKTTIEVTAEDLPDNLGESGVDVRVEAYDYDSGDHSAVMAEIFIDGRSVRGGPDELTDDRRGKHWGIIQDDGRWYFQVLMDGEVHRVSRRHDMEDYITGDVAHEVREYERAARIAEDYDDLSAWDIDELEHEVRRLEGDLQRWGHDIQGCLFRVVEEGNTDRAREGIERVHNEIANAQEAVEELEQVVDRVEQARVDE